MALFAKKTPPPQTPTGYKLKVVFKTGTAYGSPLLVPDIFGTQGEAALRAKEIVSHQVFAITMPQGEILVFPTHSISHVEVTKI